MFFIPPAFCDFLNKVFSPLSLFGWLVALEKGIPPHFYSPEVWV